MQFGNVVNGRIPEDLPVQVEVGVHDSVPHRNDVSPGLIALPITVK